jgi:hypothetical protein
MICKEYEALEPFGWNYKPADFLWEKNTVPAEKTSWIRRIISQMNKAIVARMYIYQIYYIYTCIINIVDSYNPLVKKTKQS